MRGLLVRTVTRCLPTTAPSRPSAVLSVKWPSASEIPLELGPLLRFSGRNIISALGTGLLWSVTVPCTSVIRADSALQPMVKSAATRIKYGHVCQGFEFIAVKSLGVVMR